MARYKVTAPAGSQVEGRHAGILFVRGVATVDTDNDAERRALQYFRQAGYVVEDVVDGRDVLAEAVLGESGAVVPNPPYPTDVPAGTDPAGVPFAVRVGDQGGPDAPGRVANPDQSTHDAAREELPLLPATSANKSEWIAAAQDRGWSFDNADAMTKTELIDTLRAHDEQRQADQIENAQDAAAAKAEGDKA